MTDQTKNPIVDSTQPVDYSSTNVPTTYHCNNCKAIGVKLWREYQTFLNNQTLLCVICSGKEQEKDTSNVDKNGLRDSGSGKTDQIGWRIPAVPTKENNTYWGYSSVPEEGVNWWKKLPTYPKSK